MTQSYASYTYNKQGLATDDYQVRHLTGDGVPGNLVNDHFTDIDTRGWARQYPGKYYENGKSRDAWRLDEIQSDLFQTASKGEMKDLIKLTGVDYTDIKKILIVDALDQAIKHGYDTMVIPITRSANYLTGSTDVTKAYRDLNTGILPKIRKELDKVGLKLDIKHVVDKQEIIEGSQVESAFMGNQRRLLYNEEDLREIYDYFGAEIDNIIIDQQDFKKFITDVSSNIAPESVKILKDIEQELFNPESFVIAIKDKAGKPLKYKKVNNEKGIKYRWDALSILSALGLGEAYNKNTRAS